MKSLRLVLGSLLALLIPLGLTLAWLQGSRAPGAWGQLERLLEQSRARPECERFLRNMSQAPESPASPAEAKQLLSALESHPGSSRAAQQAQELILREHTLSAQDASPRALESLAKLETFCGLLDFHAAWRKLVLGAERFGFSAEQKAQLRDLGLLLVRGESFAPARADSVYYQISTLEELERAGWVQLPGGEMNRLSQLADQLKREHLESLKKTSPETPDPVAEIRSELERTASLRRAISVLLGKLQTLASRMT